MKPIYPECLNFCSGHTVVIGGKEILAPCSFELLVKNHFGFFPVSFSAKQNTRSNSTERNSWNYGENTAPSLTLRKTTNS